MHASIVAIVTMGQIIWPTLLLLWLNNWGSILANIAVNMRMEFHQPLYSTFLQWTRKLTGAFTRWLDMTHYVQIHNRKLLLSYVEWIAWHRWKHAWIPTKSIRMTTKSLVNEISWYDTVYYIAITIENGIGIVRIWMLLPCIWDGMIH